MGFSELSRHSHLLNRCQRHGVELFLDSLNVGGRRDTGGDRPIMHVNRVMKIEYSDSVSNLIVKYTGGDDHATPLESLVVDSSFVFVHIATKQSMPQPGLLHAFSNRLLATGEAVVIKNANIRICESTCFQCLNGRFRVGSCVVNGHYCLVSHVSLSCVTL